MQKIYDQAFYQHRHHHLFFFQSRPHHGFVSVSASAATPNQRWQSVSFWAHNINRNGPLRIINDPAICRDVMLIKIIKVPQQVEKTNFRTLTELSLSIKAKLGAVSPLSRLAKVAILWLKRQRWKTERFLELSLTLFQKTGITAWLSWLVPKKPLKRISEKKSQKRLLTMLEQPLAQGLLVSRNWLLSSICRLILGSLHFYIFIFPGFTKLAA